MNLYNHVLAKAILLFSLFFSVYISLFLFGGFYSWICFENKKRLFFYFVKEYSYWLSHFFFVVILSVQKGNNVREEEVITGQPRTSE